MCELVWLGGGLPLYLYGAMLFYFMIGGGIAFLYGGKVMDTQIPLSERALVQLRLIAEWPWKTKKEFSRITKV